MLLRTHSTRTNRVAGGGGWPAGDNTVDYRKLVQVASLSEYKQNNARQTKPLGQDNTELGRGQSLSYHRQTGVNVAESTLSDMMP